MQSGNHLPRVDDGVAGEEDLVALDVALDAQLLLAPRATDELLPAGVVRRPLHRSAFAVIDVEPAFLAQLIHEPGVEFQAGLGEMQQRLIALDFAAGGQHPRGCMTCRAPHGAGIGHADMGARLRQPPGDGHADNAAAHHVNIRRTRTHAATVAHGRIRAAALKWVITMHRYFLHNEQLEEASARTLSAGQAGLLAGWGVFSTLHVSDGVLFAFERHFERMRRDASKLRVPFSVDSEALRGALLRLVQGNNAWNASLRVSIIRNQGGCQAAPDNLPAADVVAFTRDITPWPSEVRLMMKHAGRYAQGEFSGTKILSWAHNLVWYEDAHARGYDEALLLNERGEASECTSANIF